ncbi:Integrase core domain [Moraxella lacunata]|uniref:Integrase core domain n=1 Tax=Moraxella lacunata TaxID=477 RepID=A0A378QD90_MORLA|nr:integrase core domain-containing protein [Moraxella lacunata]STY98755.1 Integrase core domain [Moraxella lacunata]
MALEYKVSRPTIYKVLKLARVKLLKPQSSTNNLFKQARFGIKRLAKVEKSIQDKLKRQAKRYNKSYPGELLKGQSTNSPREYLFVAIDDYSRELYACIMPDKTAFSAAKFLTEQVIEPCPYVIDVIYSDNGTEFKGTKDHEFVKVCYDNNINQKFTKVGRPQTNGKAERVIRTLMQMWHEKCEFTNSGHRKQELTRFLNFYNTVKPHSSLTKKDETTGKTHTFTPYEWLEFYFKQSVNNG